MSEKIVAVQNKGPILGKTREGAEAELRMFHGCNDCFARAKNKITQEFKLSDSGYEYDFSCLVDTEYSDNIQCWKRSSIYQ